MSEIHSPWPLFCGDLKYARSWVLRENSLLNHENSQLLHSAISLGLESEVLELLNNNPKTIEPLVEKSIRYRIAALKGRNCYEQLFTKEELRLIQSKWDFFNQEGKDIHIAMHGGIGDHLQNISTILRLFENKGVNPILHLCPERDKQFKRLTRNILPVSVESLKRDKGIHIAEILAILEWPFPASKAWLNQNISKQKYDYDLMTCWTARGTEDNFSSWSRSLPFFSALNFFRHLISQGWNANKIIDISNWTKWEKEKLTRIGIKSYNPIAGDLKDLHDIVITSKAVISIDTSLIHLCASIGKESILLLNKFHDERWFHLLKQESSYKKNCKVINQKYFGTWDYDLKELSKVLIKYTETNAL